MINIQLVISRIYKTIFYIMNLITLLYIPFISQSIGSRGKDVLFSTTLACTVLSIILIFVSCMLRLLKSCDLSTIKMSLSVSTLNKITFTVLLLFALPTEFWTVINGVTRGSEQYMDVMLPFNIPLIAAVLLLVYTRLGLGEL